MTQKVRRLSVKVLETFDIPGARVYKKDQIRYLDGFLALELEKRGLVEIVHKNKKKIFLNRLKKENKK